MKKWKQISIVVLMTVLVSACNADNGNEDQNDENNQVTEESIDGINEDWTEVPLVLEEISDDVSRIELTNDKGGSRVILYYTDEEGPQYKSVLVKDEGRLKIISINENGEGEMFNEIVEDRISS